MEDDWFDLGEKKTSINGDVDIKKPAAENKNHHTKNNITNVKRSTSLQIQRKTHAISKEKEKIESKEVEVTSSKVSLGTQSNKPRMERKVSGHALKNKASTTVTYPQSSKQQNTSTQTAQTAQTSQTTQTTQTNEFDKITVCLSNRQFVLKCPPYIKNKPTVKFSGTSCNIWNLLSGQKYKIVIFGDSGVGKTSYAHNCLQTGIIYLRATIINELYTLNGLYFTDDSDSSKKITLRHINFWDTEGFTRMDTIREYCPIHFRYADGAICMFSIDSKKSLENVLRWITIFLEICPNKPILLLCNKCDLLLENPEEYTSNTKFAFPSRENKTDEINSEIKVFEEDIIKYVHDVNKSGVFDGHPYFPNGISVSDIHFVSREIGQQIRINNNNIILGHNIDASFRYLMLNILSGYFKRVIDEMTESGNVDSVFRENIILSEIKQRSVNKKSGCCG